MGQITFRVVLETLLLMLTPFLFCLITPSIAGSNDFPGVYESLMLLPYSFFLVVAYISIQLNQSIPFIISAFFAVSYSYLQINSLPDSLSIAAPQKAQLLSLALPVSLFAFFVVKRFRSVWFRSVMSLIVLSAPLYVLAVGSGTGLFSHSVLPQWKTSHQFAMMQLPAASLVLSLLFAYRILFIRDHITKVYYLYTGFSLIPILYVLARFGDTFVNLRLLTLDTAVFFSTASLILLYSVGLVHKYEQHVDRLTGLPNLLALQKVLRRLRKKYSIATADIDLFKRIEKVYGKEESRNMIRFVAKHLRQGSGDRVFRLDRNRFSIVYSGREDFELAEALDSVCDKLSQTDFFIRSSKSVRSKTSARDRKRHHDPIENERLQVSLSIGVAGKHQRQKPLDVFRRAYTALQTAKSEGGNLIVMQNPEPEAEFA